MLTEEQKMNKNLKYGTSREIVNKLKSADFMLLNLVIKDDTSLVGIVSKQDFEIMHNLDGILLYHPKYIKSQAILMQGRFEYKLNIRPIDIFEGNVESIFITKKKIEEMLFVFPAGRNTLKNYEDSLQNDLSVESPILQNAPLDTSKLPFNPSDLKRVK